MFFISGFISINLLKIQILTSRFEIKGDLYIKATGIVRRIDDLGRVVIHKGINELSGFRVALQSINI